MYLSFFNPDFAETLGWTLLHSLWQGVLVFVLLVPILNYFKNHTPQLRHNILCLALLVFVAGMAATFYAYFPEQREVAVATTVLSETDSPAIAGDRERSHNPTLLLSEDLPGLREKISSFIHLYSGYLVSLWLVGALFFALRWTIGMLYTYRLKRIAVTPAEQAWQKKVAGWSRKLGIRKGVRLVESIKTEVPIILGHMKPVILLPIGTLSGLYPEQVEVIIVHELAHIRRNDFLINLVLSALEMILFYHPVFWWLSNNIHQEREQCCDDIAVSLCGNPQLYARTLLLMEEKRQQNSLAMAYQGKKHHLLERIKRICMASPASYRPEFGKAGLSLALLLAIAVMSWAKMPAPSPFESVSPAITDPESMLSSEMPTESLNRANEEPEETITLETPAQASPDMAAPSELKPVPKAMKSPSRLSGDTIPYAIEIPAMRNVPKLPEPPEFPYTLEALEAELDKNADDHAFLQSTIEKYENSLDTWQDKVKAEYLSPWSNRQSEVKSFYKNWKDQIEQKGKGDDIAVAVAMKKGIKYFENAIKEHENAIKEAENTVKEDLENYIKTFENSIKYHEGKQQDHDTRMAVHDDRMAIHDLRMSAHDSRMTIHDERMSIHDIRMNFHDDRMQAHDVLMAAFEKEFFNALEADGLAKRTDEELDFVIEGDKVTVNGKVLANDQAQKYRQMVQKYGFEIPQKGQFVYQISEKSRRIGTHSSYTISKEE